MNIKDIKTTAFKYTYNTIIVKVKVNIYPHDNEIIFTIGLSNPSNKYKYENWFTKYGIIDSSGNIIINNKHIEHPPFLYYSKFILCEKKLTNFFDVFFENLFTQTIIDQEVYNKRNLKNDKAIARLYPVTFVRLSKGSINEGTIKIINDRFPEKMAKTILHKCYCNNMTVRFTDDIKFRKKLLLN